MRLCITPDVGARRIDKLAVREVQTWLNVLRTRCQCCEDEVSELAHWYREGATVYELADRFAIHRTTVSGHLHRAGVAMRGQGLDEQQADHAVRLYRQGWSMVRIGDHSGVDHRTARSPLQARGMRLPTPRG